MTLPIWLGVRAGSSRVVGLGYRSSAGCVADSGRNFGGIGMSIGVMFIDIAGFIDVAGFIE